MKACGELTRQIAPPLALLDHLLRRGPHQVKGPPHRDIHGAAEPRHVGLIEQIAVAVGRVADGDVELAELRDCLGDQALDRGLVGHVGLRRRWLANRRLRISWTTSSACSRCDR